MCNEKEYLFVIPTKNAQEAVLSQSVVAEDPAIELQCAL
jgi:hypothetical protein